MKRLRGLLVRDSDEYQKMFMTCYGECQDCPVKFRCFTTRGDLVVSYEEASGIFTTEDMKHIDARFYNTFHSKKAWEGFP